jgi:catechol 2,3-dioxygenase-like lactoylglutathione lyase family enzyme
VRIGQPATTRKVTAVGIQRVESVVYAVDDLETCCRFFDDVGLATVRRDETEAVFATLTGQTVVLSTTPDPLLPPALEKTPTVREVIWGVDTTESLRGLVAALAADRPVREDEHGVFHTVDESGFGLGLTLAAPTAIEQPDPRDANSLGRVARLNEPLHSVGPVHPLRICHVALNIVKQGREAAVALYTDRLGFIATDIVKPMGVFLRAPGDQDQHTFLLCHRPDRAGMNHISLEVPTFDHVIEGVNVLIERGWPEARRLGRHTIGSNVFRFVHAPCGGRVEFAADMDRVDDSYGTRVHETAPPHHIWTLRSSRDPVDVGP